MQFMAGYIAGIFTAVAILFIWFALTVNDRGE
jgi:hypothetical protein